MAVNPDGGEGGGSLLAPRMESRSDTGGNRVEIQESASSLQLGSGVTKFRVAAAEVGRHFVSPSECRDSAREYRISRIQDDIFARRSSAPFLLLPLRRRFCPPPLPIPFFYETGEISRCAAADPFCRREQIEIFDDYSAVMYSYIARKRLKVSGANR